MVLSQVTDQNLRHTLQFGIGLHHAGLKDKDRSLVEELFANNKIQVTLLCKFFKKRNQDTPSSDVLEHEQYFDASFHSNEAYGSVTKIIDVIYLSMGGR